MSGASFALPRVRRKRRRRIKPEGFDWYVLVALTVCVLFFLVELMCYAFSPDWSLVVGMVVQLVLAIGWWRTPHLCWYIHPYGYRPRPVNKHARGAGLILHDWIVGVEEE